jgi:hypothetical protein
MGGRKESYDKEAVYGDHDEKLSVLCKSPSTVGIVISGGAMRWSRGYGRDAKNI